MPSKQRKVGSSPTIRDVARLARISTAAAARALHGYGYASPELREAANAAAHELGYVPNRNAQAIKTKRTETIGVVGADISNPFFSAAMRGVADTAAAAGYQAFLANTDESVVKERAAIAAFVRHRVDGVVVSPADANDISHLVRAQATGIPIVLLDRDPASIPGDRVVIDNVAAAEQAVRRLLALGHRVGVVTELSGSRDMAVPALQPDDPVDIRTLGSGGVRLYGYLRAHWAAGVTVDPSLIGRTGAYSAESAFDVAREMLRRPDIDRPTALFTVDNVMSLGTYDAIVDAGLRLPEDLSLLAFDDVDWMRLVRPRITAIAQPAHEMGVLAAQLLLRRIREGGDDYESRIVPVRWTDGGSIGKPSRASSGPVSRPHRA